VTCATKGLLLAAIIGITSGACRGAAAQTVPAAQRGSAVPPDPAVRLDAATLAEVDSFIARHTGRFGWPGVAVSIGTPDSVVFARGYGTATLRGDPITERTPFRIGSVTKTFTALAVARLAEAGRLDLDAPVEEYLPEFTMRPPFVARSIVVRHLLHHRSGLAQWDGHDRRAQTEGRFDHIAPRRAPGGDAEYSSLNYMILGRIVESVSGRPYAAHVVTAILEPLGMEDAFVAGAGIRPPGRAQGHQSYFGLHVARDEPDPPPFLVPAGFLAASARDMGRYGGMLVGRGTLDGNRVVQDGTIDGLLAPLGSTGPAMAWGRGRLHDTDVLGHDGNARTSSARVRLVPERGYAIAVLVNTNTGPFLDSGTALLDGVHRILEGEPAPTLFPAERLLKGAILLGTLVSVGGMGLRGRDWRRAGYPVGLRGDARTLGRLAFDVGGAAVLLVALPRFIGVPLPTLVAYFPDLGIPLVASAGAGLVGGVLRAFVRSSR
jgi:CubicO group peptidase (beta-lactamase class C family)